MAGTMTRRCDNPACRVPVMVSNRGTIGNAFGSLVVTEADGTPVATCALCSSTTSWKRTPPVPFTTVDTGSLSQAHPSRLTECMESGHDPIPVPEFAGGGRHMKLQRTCRRCGLVYDMEIRL